LRSGLEAITAAVVGVILNLSLWFALHVFFSQVERTERGPVSLWLPLPGSIDWLALGLACISAFLLFKVHFGIAKTLLAAALMAIAVENLAVHF
jgi:chromate transporter